MTKLLDTKLFVGAINDIFNLAEDEWAFVHATQTIHYKIFGWNRTTNKPDKSHPNYIYFEKGNKLSLNWVDGAANLYTWSGAEIFTKILNFIEKWLPERNVIVHCDQGFSRSPSICLLYFAKRINLISNNSFQEAKRDFIKIFPAYNPGGIGDYIATQWHNIS